MKLTSVLSELLSNLGNNNLDAMKEHIKFSLSEGSTIVSIDTELNGIYNRKFILNGSNLTDFYGTSISSLLNGLKTNDKFLNVNEVGQLDSFSTHASSFRANPPAQVLRIRGFRGTENDEPPYWSVSLRTDATTSTEVRFNITEVDSNLQANYGEDYTGRFAVYSNEELIGYINLTGVTSSVDSIIVPAGVDNIKVYPELINDALYEGGEFLRIQAAVGSQSWVKSSFAFINDVEDLPLLTSDSISVQDNAEEGGVVSWKLTMTHAAKAPVFLEIKIDDTQHQAKIGEDYSNTFEIRSATTGELLQTIQLNESDDYTALIKMPALEQSVIVQVQTLDDDVYETDETLNIYARTTWSNEVGDINQWVKSQSAVIYNDDVSLPTVDVVACSNYVWEGGFGHFQVNLSHISNIDSLVKVNIVADINHEVSNADLGNYQYKLKGSNEWHDFRSGGSLTIPAGYSGIDVRVQVLNDNFYDFCEDIKVSASAVSGATGQSADSMLVKGYDSIKPGLFSHPQMSWHIDDDTVYVNMTELPPFSWNLLHIQGRWQFIFSDYNGNATYTYSANQPSTHAYVKTWIGKSASAFIDTGITPIVLDLDGDGLETTGLHYASVDFDFNGDGTKVETGWVSGGDGLLVYDLNQDGLINNGSELFGSNTQLGNGAYAKDGFEALAQYDDNGDGVIDAADVTYHKLQIWVDDNFDGQTDAGELRSLTQANIQSISLNAQVGNEVIDNNVHGLTSTFKTLAGEERAVVDIWFATESTDTINGENVFDNDLIPPDLYNTIMSEFGVDTFEQLVINDGAMIPEYTASQYNVAKEVVLKALNQNQLRLDDIIDTQDNQLDKYLNPSEVVENDEWQSSLTQSIIPMPQGLGQDFGIAIGNVVNSLYSSDAKVANFIDDITAVDLTGVWDYDDKGIWQLV